MPRSFGTFDLSRDYYVSTPVVAWMNSGNTDSTIMPLATIPCHSQLK